ncbi:MAG: serine hydrolase [Thermosynechococcaceae cyanobacterium]
MLLVSPQVTLAAEAKDLSAGLLQFARNAKFDHVIDYGPYNEACPGADFCPVPAPRVAHMPNVDIAVIQLDEDGQAEEAANVLFSRDYPNGIQVPIDRNFNARSVRWRKWDIERWDGGTFSDKNGQQLTIKGWKNNPPFTPADDIVPGSGSARFQFMAPYPASLFKILVAYRIMRLVDAGKLTLNQTFTYTDPIEETTQTLTIGKWLDPMIAYSDNTAARAMLKLLHERHQVKAMNAEFRNLGLATLQINGTDPKTGTNWQPGYIHMTALDTARLLWLIDGAKKNAVLWHRPDGRAVTPAELSDRSRTFLKRLLANQGYNEALSTSNFCGAPQTRPGIPAPVPDRWVNSTDGTVTVDGIAYGRDVRPCNAIASVLFAHKTGLTFNYGSDAGIVQSISGKVNRHYVIAFIANLGYRYADPIFASRTDQFPCFDAIGGICYSQRIPALGKKVDSGLKQSSKDE